MSPAQALDSLSSGANAVLIDIRTAKEKEQAGLPDLPNNGVWGFACFLCLCTVF